MYTYMQVLTSGKKGIETTEPAPEIDTHTQTSFFLFSCFAYSGM